MTKRKVRLLSYLSQRAKTKSDINEHLKLLHRMVVETGVQRIVELGTRGGNSTLAFVAGAAQTEGHVVSVDHGKGAKYAGEPPTWDGLREISALITDKLGLGSYWTLVVEDDLEFAKKYHDVIELLMIDTDHSYDQLRKELASWGTKVVDGGFIVIHDTVSFPEMNKAIWEFLDEHPSSDYVEHKNCNGLGIIIKGTRSRRRDRTRNLLNDRVTVLQQRISRMQENLLELRSRLVQREKEFSHTREEQKREFEKRIPLILDERRRELENQLIQRADNPLSALLLMYKTRPDLQSAFPEVRDGSYLRILQWARDAINSGRDSASSLLAAYGEWYVDNEWLKLVEDSNRLKEQLDHARSEISETHSKISDLEAERSGLKEQLDHARSEIQSGNEAISRLETDRSRLVEQLNRTSRELDEIRHSLGYRFMRFYASRVDHLLPDGTSRGEFRNIAVASVRIIAEQGIREFTKQALEKIKRREFRLAESSFVPVTEPSLNDDDLIRTLREFLSIRTAALKFPPYRHPEVSIVVVSYNKAHYTFQCLRSLISDSMPAYEVIVVDNASSDETRLLLRKTRNVKVIANKRNEFFPRGCNQGARAARGRYLLFLNNDAFVHPGCVSWLTKTIESAFDVGAAGAKLVWRDGRLQEAGSIIWRDGSALGYGRNDDPSKPEYNYTRDVDYCSAACLMVRRDLFEKLNGFDEAFTPAYYEDTDLCLRLGGAGFRVVYQPMAVATHIEFAGSSFKGAIMLMETQRATFFSKHASELENRLLFSPGNIIRARNRKNRPAILVVDDCVPKPGDGSGYPRMFDMVKSMAHLSYQVTLLPLTDATPKQPETGVLSQMGVEVLWGRVEAREFLESRRDGYDVILISRPHNALSVMGLVRETNPSARLIYDAEALWHRRERLRRQLGFSAADPRFESQDVELSIMRSADYVISVSEAEKELIEKELAQKSKVILLGHSHSPSPTQTPFEERRDLVFLGGFKSSPGPNDDAVVYFVKTIFPRIQEKIPGIRFIIAGSNAPDCVSRLASDSVSVIGYVEDLRELYEKCRVFVAPIRFGAGAMWKVTEAMSYGVPSVLSKVAAEGVRITHGQEALVAYDEGDFVDKTVLLYRDEGLWNRVRKSGLEYIAKNCDPVALERNLDDFLKGVSQSLKC